MESEDLTRLASRILDLPGPIRIVAIDGPGGAGKTTFAERLSAATGGAPVVHTDDFATQDNPVDWWPRLLELVITPLANGRKARYQRYDWATKTFAEWCEVDPSPIILIEGVSAARKEWLAYLSFVIWIETPPEVRLQRALKRDGPGIRAAWKEYEAGEEAHYQRDPTSERADVTIDGTGNA